MLLLAPPATARARFAFTTDTGTIASTGCTGHSGEVSVPDTVNDLPSPASETGVLELPQSERLPESLNAGTEGAAKSR